MSAKRKQNLVFVCVFESLRLYTTEEQRDYYKGGVTRLLYHYIIM